MSGSSGTERDQDGTDGETEREPPDERSVSGDDEGGQGSALEQIAPEDSSEAASGESEGERGEATGEGGAEADADAGATEELEVERLSAEELDVEEGERAVGPDDEDAAEVLYLDLEGLFVNLLGLEVDLSEVELDVSAVPGENRLLGNLLSSVAGLLDSGGLLGSLVPDIGSGEGDGLLRSLLPTGMLGSIREKLSGLVPSPGDVTGAIRERLPSPVSALRESAGNLVSRLPLEDVLAAAVQTLVKTVLQAAEDRTGEGGEEGQDVAADGGPSKATASNDDSTTTATTGERATDE